MPLFATNHRRKPGLQSKLGLDPDLFDKALEKLWIHGGGVLDYAERITRGQPTWRDSYIAQGEQKRSQIDLMIRYAETNQCRMSTLIRHFGDLADGQKSAVSAISVHRPVVQLNAFARRPMPNAQRCSVSSTSFDPAAREPLAVCTPSCFQAAS